MVKNNKENDQNNSMVIQEKCDQRHKNPKHDFESVSSTTVRHPESSQTRMQQQLQGCADGSSRRVLNSSPHLRSGINNDLVVLLLRFIHDIDELVSVDDTTTLPQEEDSKDDATIPKPQQHEQSDSSVSIDNNKSVDLQLQENEKKSLDSILILMHSFFHDSEQCIHDLEYHISTLALGGRQLGDEEGIAGTLSSSSCEDSSYKNSNHASVASSNTNDASNKIASVSNLIAQLILRVQKYQMKRMNQLEGALLDLQIQLQQPEKTISERNQSNKNSSTTSDSMTADNPNSEKQQHLPKEKIMINLNDESSLLLLDSIIETDNETDDGISSSAEDNGNTPEEEFYHYSSSSSPLSSSFTNNTENENNNSGNNSNNVTNNNNDAEIDILISSSSSRADPNSFKRKDAADTPASLTTMPTTPPTIYDLNLSNNTSSILKKEVHKQQLFEARQALNVLKDEVMMMGMSSSSAMSLPSLNKNECNERHYNTAANKDHSCANNNRLRTAPSSIESNCPNDLLLEKMDTALQYQNDDDRTDLYDDDNDETDNDDDSAFYCATIVAKDHPHPLNTPFCRKIGTTNCNENNDDSNSISQLFRQGLASSYFAARMEYMSFSRPSNSMISSIEVDNNNAQILSPTSTNSTMESMIAPEGTVNKLQCLKPNLCVKTNIAYDRNYEGILAMHDGYDDVTPKITNSILDRFRVDPDESSPHGFRVVPNDKTFGDDSNNDESRHLHNSLNSYHPDSNENGTVSFRRENQYQYEKQTSAYHCSTNSHDGELSTDEKTTSTSNDYYETPASNSNVSHRKPKVYRKTPYPKQKTIKKSSILSPSPDANDENTITNGEIKVLNNNRQLLLSSSSPACCTPANMSKPSWQIEHQLQHKRTPLSLLRSSNANVDVALPNSLSSMKVSVNSANAMNKLVSNNAKAVERTNFACFGSSEILSSKHSRSSSVLLCNSGNDLYDDFRRHSDNAKSRVVMKTISKGEYDFAPDSVRVYASLQHLQTACDAFNFAIRHQSASTIELPPNKKYITPTEAHRLLHSFHFTDPSLRENLLIALCYFHRLQIMVPNTITNQSHDEYTYGGVDFTFGNEALLLIVESGSE